MIRAAVPYLSSTLRKKLFTFISLSSPHLGYDQSSSHLISAGMWMMQKVRPCQSLKELQMKDSTTETSVLYKISKEGGGLKDFQNILLVSSKQDTYAPPNSARIEVEGVVNGENSSVESVFMQMCNNIWTRDIVKHSEQRIYKLDVDFRFSENSFDTYVGRAAHIQFLDNTFLLRGILMAMPFLFV